jgi:hypothetical protein
MHKNEVFEYYIDDAMNDPKSFQMNLNSIMDLGAAWCWSDFIKSDFLFVGEVNNRLVLANKISHNKADIQKYNSLSNSDIHQENFKLLSTLTFEQASLIDIIRFENGEYVYQIENAKRYIQEYKLG